MRACHAAYPRSHGATVMLSLALLGSQGLSPLARGNHIQEARIGDGQGPIPARTGQPDMDEEKAKEFGAYPRSHGATLNAAPLTVFP